MTTKPRKRNRSKSASKLAPEKTLIGKQVTRFGYPTLWRRFLRRPITELGTILSMVGNPHEGTYCVLTISWSDQTTSVQPLREFPDLEKYIRE